MHQLKIGDVTVECIVERDGPWRKVENMFPTVDLAVAKKHLAEMEPFVYDPASDKARSSRTRPSSCARHVTPS